MKLFERFVAVVAPLLILSSCADKMKVMDFVWSDGIRSEMNITLGFQLDKPFPSPSATLQLCAANAYMVFQDDEMIAFGPARTAHGYIRMDEIQLENLTPRTKLTVTVIGNNINSFCYPDEKPFFAARVMDGRGKQFAGSWDFSCSLLDDRIRKVVRFSYQRDFSEAYRMKKDRSEYYKGSKDLFQQLGVSSVQAPQIIEREVSYPKYDRMPMSVVEDGRVTVDETLPVWNARFIDNISDKSSKGYERSDLEVCASDELSRLVYDKLGDGRLTIKGGEYCVTDAGRTITGFFDLRLKVDEPSLLYILFDEIDMGSSDTEGIVIDFKRNTCVSAVRYELEPGDYHLVNFELLSARFLKFVCLSGSVEVADSKLITFENPDMFRLDFKCADDSLNLIVKASQNTLAQNGVDLFTDCPQRERAGWLCDALFSARAEFLMTGENVVDRCFLENYALAPQLPELPEGMIPMCYPGDHISGEFIPNWSMWYVLQLYDYYKRTGDVALVAKSKGKIEGLLRYFAKFENEYGMLENLENWVFVEWSKANDFTDGVNFPSNMLYCEMLIKAGELLSDDSLVEKGRDLKKTVAEFSFNGEFFEDNMVREDGKLVRTGNTTETCQYYAIYFGVASETGYPEFHEKMLTVFGPSRDASKVYPSVYPSNSFIGNYLRMEILRLEERTAQILDESKQFFYYMAKRTGTLWENNKPEGSLNHGFASYAANVIIEAVTGISDYDAASNCLRVIEPEVKMDCWAEIPFKGDKIIVNFEGEDRNIIFPQGLATN